MFISGLTSQPALLSCLLFALAHKDDKSVILALQCVEAWGSEHLFALRLQGKGGEGWGWRLSTEDLAK